MRKRGKIRITGILLLVMAVIVACIPVPKVEATSSALDFRMDGDKLVKYEGTDVNVSVPDTVVTIGAEAFADNTEITSVTLPDTITSIEYGAFSDCTSLLRINIPNSVTNLGSSVFYNCPSLSDVSIGTGLKELGNGAFSGCTNLSTVKIDLSNQYFVCVNGAIYDIDKRNLYQVLAGRTENSYSMPDTVVKIEPYAFWGDSQLNAVFFSNNLVTIGEYAFSNAKGLEQIILPYTVTSIEAKAFEYCTGLMQISIPASVSYIHMTAFDNCDQLNINADEGTVAATFSEAFEIRQAEELAAKAYSIANGNTQEDNNSQTTTKDAVANNGSTQSATGDNLGSENASTNDGTQTAEGTNDGQLPSDDQSTDSQTMDQSVIGKSIVVANNAVFLIDNTGISVISGNAGSSTDSGADSNTSTDANLTGADILPQEAESAIVTEILEKQFYRNTDLNQYDIPDTVTKIGDFAFARSSLTDITIPEAVETIGYAAFYHCDNLENVTIPNTVTQIDSMAFSKTKWMNNWLNADITSTEEDAFLIVGDGILLAYRGNSANVTIPADVKIIGADAFSQHTEIESVEIPGSVTQIGDNAFGGCSKLTKITGALNVTSISDDAFAGCGVTLLSETVTIDENQTAIPLGSYFIVKNEKLVNWIAIIKWSSIVSVAILALFMIVKTRPKQIKE